jgi:proteasome lid subunit RPN8/RPN11
MSFCTPTSTPARAARGRTPMALRTNHRYVAEASASDGRRLGELVLAPDFTPAAEWSHLQGVRLGAFPALAHHGPCVVEPAYDETLGRPYVAGIRVRFEAADPAYEAPLIPWSYFQQCVEGSAKRLVVDGALRAGEAFVYRICAFPAHGEQPAAAAAPEIAVDEACVALALEHAALAPRLARAQRMCEAAWNTADFPLFVQPTVLDQTIEMARAAGEHETGGILVGHVRRDTASCEIHAEITAQIPATHAHAGPTHLRFTAQTWSAVSDALALRGRNEIWLGWHHYHPFFCRRCDPARRHQCVLSRPFFSREDCELHRTVFDAAFSVALLLTDIGEESPSCDWFGWRRGRVAARGCYLMSRDGASTFKAHAGGGAMPAARVLSVSEEDHEN